MNFTISKLYGQEILDSRGNPTVEVECTLGGGVTARAAVPSGASTGSREAVELRDCDPSRFGGKGVLKAVDNVNGSIREALMGQDARQQARIDEIMLTLDGTPNKATLGANAILGVSLAVCRAAAQAADFPLYEYLGGPGATRLPVPHLNIMNGGVHARWQGADFQEFMIAPHGAPTFREALRWASEIYQALRSVLMEAHLEVGVGDEGGFAPKVSSNHAPLEFICKGIEKAGFKPGMEVGIALDPASSEFHKDGKYHLHTENRQLSSEEMVSYYEKLVRDFPIGLIEDGLAEDDWNGWTMLNAKLGHLIELVGDDIFCTNPAIIAEGIQKNIANAALIKLNQIGSVSETIQAIKLCGKNGWGAFVSHRSGETVDSFIADLTVGLDCGHLKTGAPARGERVEKYNQLMRIERHLGSAAAYAGAHCYVRPIRG